MRILLLVIAIFYFACSYSQISNITHDIEYNEALSEEDVLGKILITNRQNNSFSFKKINSFNASHQRYQQYYHGKEIFSNQIILHYAEGRITSSSGDYISGYSKDVNESIVSEKDAIDFATLIYKQSNKLPFGSKLSKANDLTIKTKEIYINKFFPSTSIVELVPAYYIQIENKDLHMGYNIVVDGVNGGVILKENRICSTLIEGEGTGIYCGKQKFNIDSLSPNKFQLYDESRNVYTYLSRSDNKQTLVEGTSKNFSDNYKGKEAGVIDLHHMSGKFYDMMLTKFGYRGIDGLGMPLKGTLETASYVNAFWNGEGAFFGSGTCHYNPLTTYTIVAHEYTHGVTQKNSNLVYSNESGAINEAFSDVFGKALEYYEDKQNFDWLLDKRFLNSPYSSYFRTMNNPEKHKHPKRYKGQNWIDNAGVHTNSGVLNYWFTLMIDGGNGTDEGGSNYDIKKQSIDDVLQVLFKCQSDYLTPNSGYNALYASSMIACKELYGESSELYAEMNKAWKVVGLPNAPAINKDLSISISGNRTKCGDFMEYLPVEIEVSNVGNVIIKKGEILNVKIGTRSMSPYELKEDLLPEKSLIVNYDEGVLYENSYAFENVSLEYVDENILNNSSYLFYVIYNNVPEISLVNSGSNFLTYNCGEKEIYLNGVITNESCNENFENDDIFLEIFDINNSSILEKFKLEKNGGIERGEYLQFNIKMPESFIEVNKLYNFRILIPSKNVLYENFSEIKIEGGKLDKGIDYVFEDLGTLFPDFIGNERGRIEKNFTFKQRKLVKFSAYFSNPPCSEDLPTFEYRTCADFSKMNSPILTFDLIQFVNDSILLEGFKELSNVFEVSFYPENGNPDINKFDDFSDGTEQNYIVSIPEKFKGEFVVRIYLAMSTSQPNKKGDVLMLDNFRIQDLVAASDVDESLPEIYPNPSSDKLFVKNIQQGEKFKIYNILGRLIKESRVEEPIDISSMNNGVFFIEFESYNQRLKFVKSN